MLITWLWRVFLQEVEAKTEVIEQLSDELELAKQQLAKQEELLRGSNVDFQQRVPDSLIASSHF